MNSTFFKELKEKTRLITEERETALIPKILELICEHVRELASCNYELFYTDEAGTTFLNFYFQEYVTDITGDERYLWNRILKNFGLESHWKNIWPWPELKVISSTPTIEYLKTVYDEVEINFVKPVIQDCNAVLEKINNGEFTVLDERLIKVHYKIDFHSLCPLYKKMVKDYMETDHLSVKIENKIWYIEW